MDIKHITESIKNDNSATEDPRVLKKIETRLYDDFHASQGKAAKKDLTRQNYLIAGLMFLVFSIMFAIFSGLVTCYVYLPGIKPETANFTWFFFTYGLISFIPALILSIPAIITFWCTRKSTSDSIRYTGFIFMIITLIYFLVMIGFCVYFLCFH